MKVRPQSVTLLFITSSRSLPWSTRHCLDTLPVTWLTTAASSPTPAPETPSRHSVRFLLVRRVPS